jgi:hypothetical protein
MDDVAEADSRPSGTEVKYRNVTPEELKADRSPKEVSLGCGRYLIESQGRAKR